MKNVSNLSRLLSNKLIFALVAYVVVALVVIFIFVFIQNNNLHTTTSLSEIGEVSSNELFIEQEEDILRTVKNFATSNNMNSDDISIIKNSYRTTNMVSGYSTFEFDIIVNNKKFVVSCTQLKQMGIDGTETAVTNEYVISLYNTSGELLYPTGI